MKSLGLADKQEKIKRKGVGMKNNSFSTDDHRLANHLSSLVGKVLKYHDVDELPRMVLHELGHDHCFGLKKAVYLVDNPDFNHLAGVGGFCSKECCHHKKDMWQNPHMFKEDMKNAQFYNDVKSFLHDSLKRKDIDLNSAKDLKELGKKLGLQDPHFFSWNMKHGNHGILLFEQSDKNICEWRKGLLQNTAAILSFCGI